MKYKNLGQNIPQEARKELNEKNSTPDRLQPSCSKRHHTGGHLQRLHR